MRSGQHVRKLQTWPTSCSGYGLELDGQNAQAPVRMQLIRINKIRRKPRCNNVTMQPLHHKSQGEL